jgi:ornithine--oxo-acid transaminase
MYGCALSATPLSSPRADVGRKTAASAIPSATRRITDRYSAAVYELCEGYAPAVIRELLETRAGEDYELYARGINPQFMRVLKTIGFDRVWARAEGQYLYDEEDRRYLDLVGGFGMFNVGRNNPRVRDALVEVLELATPGSVQLGVSLLPGLLAEELLNRTPARLARVLFTNSGTEAVEAALKLGRAATGRTRVVSCEHGFHGLTLGSLSASGDRHFVDRFGPLLPGFSQVRFGDLDALERELRSEDVALFLVEPVQGKGVNLPPAGYLEGAQELCRRYGTLFAVDEVQTGLGRTGRLFAFEHWGLEPDLVTVAKSLSGGYVPVGALLMASGVYDGVFDSLEHSVSHGSTFAPNDLAMAAGLATLRELDTAQLVARAATLGDRLLERTREVAEEHEVVREVRGVGLMWAMEFGEPDAGSLAWRLMERMQSGLFAQLVVVPLFTEHRVLSQVAGHDLPVLKGLPPLVLSEQDVDDFASALDDVIGKAGRPTRVAGLALRAARAR